MRALEWKACESRREARVLHSRVKINEENSEINEEAADGTRNVKHRTNMKQISM